MCGQAWQKVLIAALHEAQGRAEKAGAGGERRRTEAGGRCGAWIVRPDQPFAGLVWTRAGQPDPRAQACFWAKRPAHGNTASKSTRTRQLTAAWSCVVLRPSHFTDPESPPQIPLRRRLAVAYKFRLCSPELPLSPHSSLLPLPPRPQTTTANFCNYTRNNGHRS